MDSFLAWMSFSESERRRVMDAIDTLRQKDARDELGLGAIRDGFADLLFPGTGTVQTRAKYFLFVPWIYRELEAKGKDPAEVARLAREMEIGLIEALEALEAGGERDGIIGIVARRRLKRLPSNIYWLGLQTWRICQVRGGQDDFHRSLRRRTPLSLLRNDDGELADGAGRGAWHAGLPPKSADFPKKATFSLAQREAEYLRERVLTTAPGTLLSFLVREDAGWEPAAFPWEHPSFGSFPADLRDQLRQARRFSEAMHGAAILYNFLLGEKTGNEERIGIYREWIEEWMAERRAEAPPPAGPWPDAAFWAMASRSGRTISARTQGFAREWVAHVANVAGGTPPDSPSARDLVLRRELEVKGSQKARLHNEAAGCRGAGPPRGATALLREDRGLLPGRAGADVGRGASASRVPRRVGGRGRPGDGRRFPPEGLAAPVRIRGPGGAISPSRRQPEPDVRPELGHPRGARGPARRSPEGLCAEPPHRRLRDGAPQSSRRAGRWRSESCEWPARWRTRCVGSTSRCPSPSRSSASGPGESKAPGGRFPSGLFALVISPFLSSSTLERLAGDAENVVVSTDLALREIEPKSLRAFGEARVLTDAVEPEETEESEETAGTNELSGLHAKVFVFDQGWNASVWTGSANATEAAFRTNVEFLVNLRGKKSLCGVDSMLGLRQGATTFGDLLVPFQLPESWVAPKADPAEERLDAARRAVALAGLRAQASPLDEKGELTVRLAMKTDPGLPAGVTVRCRPISTSAAFGQPLPAAGASVEFGRFGIDGLTSFFAFDVAVATPDGERSCRFVVNVPLEGVPADRSQRIVRHILRDAAAVVSFIRRMLSMDGDVPGDEGLGSPGGERWKQGAVGENAAGLFEQIVRAVHRTPERLDALAAIMEDLRSGPDAAERLPEGLLDLWDAALAAREAMRP